MAETASAYPVSLSVDYPDRSLNRLTSFFRLIVILPILIVLGLLTASNGGFIIVPTILLLLFRQKYPRWWFDWNLALVKFSECISECRSFNCL